MKLNYKKITNFRIEMGERRERRVIVMEATPLNIQKVADSERVNGLVVLKECVFVAAESYDLLEAKMATLRKKHSRFRLLPMNLVAYATIDGKELEIPVYSILEVAKVKEPMCNKLSRLIRLLLGILIISKAANNTHIH